MGQYKNCEKNHICELTFIETTYPYYKPMIDFEFLYFYFALIFQLLFTSN